jgi:hypothetical protein
MEDQDFQAGVQQIQDRVQALTDLAKRLKIRSPAKLLAAARGKVAGATLELAKAALEFEVSKQVLAPKFRSTGKSAAEGPNERLQADLIDFSQNTKTKQKYALLVNDVYTREVRAKALPNKTPEVVNAAAQELIPELVGGKQDFSITTDKGREFNLLEQAIGEEAVHREKQSMNDISVLDRSMQTVKKDMAADVADGRKQNWVEALNPAVEAHNERPHSSTYVAPSKVEETPAADFRILQDNARKFMYNRNAQQRKKTALQEAGAFRAPTTNTRSFEPQYGDVQVLGSKRRDDPPDKVRNTGQGEYLLKQIQPVPRGSLNAAGRLTDKNLPRKIRLQERAKDLEAYISDIGGQIALNSLERVLRRGEIDNLYNTMRKNQITIRGFLKLYNEIFKVNRGIVTLRMAQPVSNIEPVAPAPAPAPVETPEERRARMDRQFEASQRLREEQDRAREQRQRERQQQRIGGVRAAFGVAPRG